MCATRRRLCRISVSRASSLPASRRSSHIRSSSFESGCGYELLRIAPISAIDSKRHHKTENIPHPPTERICQNMSMQYGFIPIGSGNAAPVEKNRLNDQPALRLSPILSILVHVLLMLLVGFREDQRRALVGIAVAEEQILLLEILLIRIERRIDCRRAGT